MERWILCYRILLTLLFISHVFVNIYLGIEYNPSIPVWNIIVAFLLLLSGVYYEKKRRELVTNRSGYYYHGIDTTSTPTL